MEQEYSAPWGRSLRVATILSVAVLVLIALLGLTTGPREFFVWRLAMVDLPIIVALAGVPFMVRGYRLTDREIFIRRPGWTTTLSLDGLRSVGANPELIEGSLRLFGNGGMFVFAGWFWNRRLGRYRAWLNDPSRAVLLEFADRKIVISPHDPQGFVLRVRKLIAMGA